MSTLPIPVWSVEATYPAGALPWSSQPTKVAPVGDTFVPNTKPPAQNVNWILNGFSAALQGLQSYTLPGMAVQWQPAIAQGTISTMGPDFGAICFDPSLQQWVVATLHDSTVTFDAWVSGGLDGITAGAWQALGTATAAATAIVSIDITPDPATPGDYWVVEGHGSWVVRAIKYAPFSWTVKDAQTTGSTIRNVACCAFNGYFLYAVADSTGNLGFSATNNGGSTWTRFITSIPAMPSGSSWLLQSNTIPSGVAGGTNMVLAIPCNAALGAATQVWKSTDGVTWTVSATLSGLPSGASVVGLAWGADAIGACWILTVQTGAKATTVLRSGDGATWTTQRATGPAFNLSDLASNGMTFAATTVDASSGGPSTSIFSMDGGITWYPTQEQLFASEATSFAGYTRPRIRASGVGFATWNNLWMRFSANAGLPTVSY